VADIEALAGNPEHVNTLAGIVAGRTAWLAGAADGSEISGGTREW
jgi:hypothetical protein